MNTPRTQPNLLEEARHLTDDSFAYGALILARAVGRAVEADGIVCQCPPGRGKNIHLAHVAREYGEIVAAAAPRNIARRHVILTDAADLAFA